MRFNVLPKRCRRSAGRRWCSALAILLLAAGASAGWAQDQATVEQKLAQAKLHYDASEYPLAEPILTELVNLLQGRAGTDQVAREQLASVYGMRARSLAENGNWDAAREDMRAALLLAPGFRLSARGVKISREFETIRKATVGDVVVAVTPPEARIAIDGSSVASGSTPVSLLPGAHLITARLVGFKEQTQAVHVVAGAAPQSVSLVLERVFATLSLVSVPGGADVYVDGKLVGATPAGPPASDSSFVIEARKSNISADKLSGILVIDGLTIGDHSLELRKPCYITDLRPRPIAKLEDFILLKVLQPATGAVDVTTPQPGASVSLGGVSRGQTPLAIRDVCEGEYTIDVSADHGTYSESIKVETGKTAQVTAQLKPVFGLVALTGHPDRPTSRRAAELRAALRQVGAGGTVSITTPAPDQVKTATDPYDLKDDRWLSFDQHRNALGPLDAHANVDAATLRDISAQISKALGVQGVATATVNLDLGPDHLYLSLLASGSALPDILEIDLADQDQMREVARRLAGTPSLFRPTLGLLAVDVADIAGVVITDLQADGPAIKANLKVGDVITRADGQAISSARALAAALATAGSRDRVNLSVTNDRGLGDPVPVPLLQTPRLVSMTDKSVLFNKLILDFRAMIAGGLTPNDEPVVRLNLAVSLMAVGNFADARKEIGRVTLESGPGVSKDTVVYLLGVCLEKLGEYAEADRQFALAALSKDALLTEDGERVAELVRQRKAPSR